MEEELGQAEPNLAQTSSTTKHLSKSRASRVILSWIGRIVLGLLLLAIGWLTGAVYFFTPKGFRAYQGAYYELHTAVLEPIPDPEHAWNGDDSILSAYYISLEELQASYVPRSELENIIAQYEDALEEQQADFAASSLLGMIFGLL